MMSFVVMDEFLFELSRTVDADTTFIEDTTGGVFFAWWFSSQISRFLFCLSFRACFALPDVFLLVVWQVVTNSCRRSENVRLLVT